ncbi:hypothetical protein JMUB6875_71900 [Nocardia sp. JMUB6875]
MVDHLGPVEGLTHGRRVQNIAVDPGDTGLARAGGSIDGCHLVTAIRKQAKQIGAKEPGSAGDCDLHGDENIELVLICNHGHIAVAPPRDALGGGERHAGLDARWDIFGIRMSTTIGGH